MSLKKKVEEYAKLFEELGWNTDNFVKVTSLKHLSQSVYTDGKLVYKFDPHSDEAKALKRVKGVKGVQQIVLFHKGVLISKLVNAKPFHPSRKYSREQLKGLMKTLIELNERKVEFDDYNLGNLLFSSKEGFTLVDVSCEEKPSIKLEDLLYSIKKGKTDKEFLYTYANLLEIFHEINSELAKKNLLEKINSYKKCSYKKLCDKRLLSKFKKIFEKYSLSFENLSYNRFHGLFKLH